MDENRAHKEDFVKIVFFFRYSLAVAKGLNTTLTWKRLLSTTNSLGITQVDSLGEEMFSHVISAYSSSKERFSTQPCPSFRNCIVTLHFALHYAAERWRVNKDVRVVTWQKVTIHVKSFLWLFPIICLSLKSGLERNCAGWTIPGRHSVCWLGKIENYSWR